jgi:hypothetical protein
LICIISVLVLIWMIIVTKTSNQKSFVKVYLDEWKHSSKFNKYFEVFELLKRMLASLVLFLFYYLPFHQIGMLSVINTWYFSFFVRSLPRKNFGENMRDLFKEGMFFIINLLLTILYYDFTTKIREKIGLGVLSLTFLVTAVDLSFLFYDQYKMVVKIFKSCRRKRASIEFGKLNRRIKRKMV